MAGPVPQEKSMEEVRQQSAVSMEGFIKHHMLVILQPFIDHVEALDSRLCELSERLTQTDANAVDTNSRLEAAKALLTDLRDGVIDRTNTRIQKLQEGMERCVQNHELLHSGHEDTKGQLRHIQNQICSSSGQQPELQRSLLQLEEEVKVLQQRVNGTADDLENSVRRGMSLMSSDLQDLKTREGKTENDLQKLQAELAHTAHLLHDAREVLDKTVSSNSSLQRHFQDMLQREAQMGARVEGWKHQWSKINPALDALRKEAAHLKQRSDHHDAVVHGLQQGYATTFSSVEALDGKHSRLTNEVEAVQERLAAAQKGLADTRDELGKATAFSNTLHTELERTYGELGRTSQKLGGLESRHDALMEHVEKTTGSLAELARGHQASVSELEAMQQDLRRTNDQLSGTRSLLEVTNSGLQGVKTDLGRTNDAVQRLDHGVELCHAGFSGLQKGFQETGNHIHSRPITLPKLPGGGSSLRSPRHHDASLSSLTTTVTGGASLRAL